MMKKTLTFIAGAVVLIFVLGYLRMRYILGKVEYGIAKGVKPEKLSFREVVVYLPIWIYNPTGSSIVLSNLDLNIFMDKVYVSSITSNQSYRLNPDQKTTYPMTISIKPADIIELLRQKGQVIDDPDWLSKIEVTVMGSVDMDLGWIALKKIPVKFSDNLRYYLE
jgi:LEA14-like dessication related protein